MALTVEERAIALTRLTEAEAALHKLVTGTQARVFVDQNGERVEFRVAQVRELRGYVMELRGLLGKSLGTPGPMTPWMM